MPNQKVENFIVHLNIKKNYFICKCFHVFKMHIFSNIYLLSFHFLCYCCLTMKKSD
ncbi:hypothetical protein X975_06586, partial [Stegodyphus mimosarum]